ncbi:MAG: RDD family protein [Elusimicrobiota bacterium]|jgi:uncharacterized RDD family membrane protein YckC|nr:RDD family protein [Elusimicrobiota bacterium]
MKRIKTSRFFSLVVDYAITYAAIIASYFIWIFLISKTDNVGMITSENIQALLSSSTRPVSMMGLAIMIIYECICPIFFYGKTLSKQFFKLQIASADDQPLSSVQIIIRGLVKLLTTNMIFISTVITVIAPPELFKKADIIFFVFVVINCCLVLFSKDTLYDKLAKTKIK